jgi:hypothetical protein
VTLLYFDAQTAVLAAPPMEILDNPKFFLVSNSGIGGSD